MDKKNKIIVAAISEFAKNGFEKASMDAIALKAKVAKGTIFYHFRSKDVLFAGIVEEGHKRLEEKMIRETNKLNNNTDKIKKIIEIEIGFIKKYRDLFLVYLEDVVKKSISFEVIKKCLNEGKENGEFRKDMEVEIVALSIFWSTAMVCLNHKKNNVKEIGQLVLKGIEFR